MYIFLVKDETHTDNIIICTDWLSTQSC